MDLLAINGVSSLEELLTQKNNVLIGGNGSGKSRALECIFQENINLLDKELLNNKYIVCFSSGQNERFSSSYRRHLKKKLKDMETPNLNCFFYNKSWSKLLIFLASTQVRNGKTRKFLKDNNYIQLTPDIHDDLKDDITSTLEIGFRVLSRYIVQVRDALKKEESGEEINTIRTRPLHRILESFIDTIVNIRDYDFDRHIISRKIVLNTEKLNLVSYDQMATDSLGNHVVLKIPKPKIAIAEKQDTLSTNIEEQENSELSTFVETQENPYTTRLRNQLLTIPIVSFFTQAAYADKFIIKSGAKLYFKNPNSNERLEIDELSDGEYQLLFLYALIDLFDTPNTIFLLDEIDAHIHYKNIHKLWEIINTIQGKCIITTHLLDSITQAGIENIYTVEKGKIIQGKQSKELKDRLAELSNLKNATLKSYSLYPKIVLIDDLNDWEIFKRLAIKKLANNETEKKCIKQQLENILCIKKPSNYDGKNLAIAKTMWLENFINFAKAHSVNTQSIYLICDRDDLPLNQIKKDLRYIIPKDHPHNNLIKKQASDTNIKASILVWRRREIKHYLLSHTALSDERNSLNKINSNTLAFSCHLKPNESADDIEEENEETNEKETKHNEGIAQLESKKVKKVLKPIIDLTGDDNDDQDYGLDLQKLQAYIDLIPPEEISEDIENMYNFIVGNS